VWEEWNGFCRTICDDSPFCVHLWLWPGPPVPFLLLSWLFTHFHWVFPFASLTIISARSLQTGNNDQPVAFTGMHSHHLHSERRRILLYMPPLCTYLGAR